MTCKKRQTKRVPSEASNVGHAVRDVGVTCDVL